MRLDRAVRLDRGVEDVAIGVDRIDDIELTPIEDFLEMTLQESLVRIQHLTPLRQIGLDRRLMGHGSTRSARGRASREMNRRGPSDVSVRRRRHGRVPRAGVVRSVTASAHFVPLGP